MSAPLENTPKPGTSAVGAGGAATSAPPENTPEPGGDFRALQMKIGQHLRDPASAPAPAGLEERRLQIYRDLLFNNVEGFLSSGFPVLRKIYADEDWTRLARAFYRCHRAHTPYFSEIGAEFVSWLSQEYQPGRTDPPFLAELAHYEYAETALFTAEDPRLSDEIDANLSPRKHLPVLTPLAWVFSYHWPVHTISADCAPWQMPAQRTHLLLYRDRLDQVHFLLISPAAARLVVLIREQYGSRPALSGEAIVDLLIGQCPEYSAFRDQALAEIDKLHRRGIVVGAIATKKRR